jgi:hypothetical protein
LALTLWGNELVNHYIKWMEKRADDLIAQNWPLVNALAERLLAVGTLNYHDTLKVVSEFTRR